MSDFSAKILAQLDTSKIPNQIKDIEKNEINLQLNAANLASQVQAALNKQKFTINLDGLNLSNVTKQFQTAGTTAGNNFSKSFNTSAAAIQTTTSNTAKIIQDMQKTLANLKFDNSSIDLVTKDLENMNLAISNVTTKINEKNLDISIRGIDELGRAVTIVKQFDYETGNITSLGKTISQSFDTGAAAAKEFANTLKQANESIKNGSIVTSLTKVTTQYEKLGATGHKKLSEIKSDIEALTQLQNTMNTATDDTVLVDSYTKFNEVLDRVKNNLTTVSLENSTLASQIKSQMTPEGLEASIAKVTEQYAKLGATGHDKLQTIKTDIDTLKRLQRELSSSSDDETLVSNYQQFNETLSRVKNNLTTVSAESKTFVSNLQLRTLDNSIATWMEKNSKATKTFGSSIQDLRSRLSELITSGNATEAELKEIEAEFNSIKQSAIAAGEVGRSFASTFQGAFKSILNYVSVSTIIYQSINALKQMGENVVAIDTAMTELKKVTDETAASYDKFLSNAGSVAKEIGSTVTDYINSTADFSRLGYDFADAQELAKVANIYSVVGDEIDSVDDATSSIISTMKAFGIEASDAITIVDRFNEVGKCMPNDMATYRKKVAISVKSQKWSRPSKDLIIILIYVNTKPKIQ